MPSRLSRTSLMISWVQRVQTRGHKLAAWECFQTILCIWGGMKSTRAVGTRRKTSGPIPKSQTLNSKR